MRLDERLRSWKRQAPAWAISIGFHALVLLLAGMISWVVIQGRAEDRPVMLRQPEAGVDEAGDDGGGSGGGREATASPAAPSPKAVMMPPAPAPTALAEAAAELPPQTASELFASADPASDLARALAASPNALESPGPGLGTGLLDGTSSGFGRHIGQLRGAGLEVVLVLDATDSMTPYIEQGKKRLHEILDMVNGLVPNARFGIVAYKDYGDDYGPDAVKSVAITNDVAAIRKFIDEIVAGGGADIPEPINEAVRTATSTEQMGWDRRRRRVIILVGDSPCHPSGRKAAFGAAAAFAKQGGTVNVIDVGGAGAQGAQRKNVQPDLAGVAEAGGGEAFLLRDTDAFWRHLIVSVFGQRFEQDVEIIIKKLIKEE